jgi:hypothetical protein
MPSAVSCRLLAGCCPNTNLLLELLLVSGLDRLLPKSSGHSFEGGDATRIILSPNEHIARAVRTCRGSIYRTRNDGRHKCRPYEDLKRKFLYYQVIKLEVTLLCKLDLGNNLLALDPG